MQLNPELDDFYRMHVLHSENGDLADSYPASTTDHIVAMLDAAAETKNGLVVYIHGGLVSLKSALTRAVELNKCWSGKMNAHVVFFAWESSFIETFVNRLFPPVLRRIVERTAEIVEPFVAAQLEQLSTSQSGMLRGRPAAVMYPPAELRDQLLTDAQLRSHVDLAFELGPGSGSTQQEQTALDGLRVADQRVPVDSYQAMFETPPVEDESLVDAFRMWPPLERFVHQILRIYEPVLRREHMGRSHGSRQTIEEEIIRNLKIGNAAWDSMKKQTTLGVREEPTACGNALVSALLDRERMSAKPIPKITIVGHSAGSIFACNIIKLAKRRSLAQKIDLVLLAPAVTHAYFAQTLRTSGDMIGKFRMFTMNDELEQADGVPDLKRRWYRHSLLYLVSGSFETRPDDDIGVEGGVPVVGMRRFHDMDSRFLSDDERRDIAEVEAFISTPTQRGFWSKTPTNSPLGEISQADTHGGFPEDSETRESTTAFVTSPHS